ncbi:MAG: synthase subunit delta [Bacteroidota bacterium]|jgi:F-type H+-transporting ATPase subunit delta
MGNIKLAGRYAKSLIDLAIEKNQLDVVYNDAVYFNTVAQNSDFAMMMRSPIIKSDKKNAIFQAIFQNSISEITASFLKIVIQKGREIFLKDMMLEVENQYNAIKGIKTVKLTTAVSVDSTTTDKIKNLIQQTATLTNVNLKTSVNEKLIGGFVLEFDDKLFDASILNDLKAIKKQFLENDYISKI